MKDETQALVMNNNGYFGEEVSSSKFSHLLASKDRDFLLSPSGAQVLHLSLVFFFLQRQSEHPLGNS